jgi:hypothetical protein
LAVSDPPNARRYARAALLLAAHEDFDLGPYAVWLIAIDLSTYQSVAQLSRSQADALRGLLVSEQAKWDLVHKLTTPTYDAADRLIERQEGDMPADLTATLVLRLRDWWTAMPEDILYRYNAINEAWQLRNLAVARRNTQAQAALESLLQDWRNGTSDPTIQMWISEALSHTGEYPTQPQTMVLR